MPTGPGSIVGRTAFAALMAPDIWEVYEMTGKERPTEYDKLFNIKEMPWNPVKLQAVAGLGATPYKPEGSPFVLDSPVIENALSIYAPPFGTAVEFTWEAWRDEQYGVFHDMSRELSRSVRFTVEGIGYAILNFAFSATSTVSLNGVGFNNEALLGSHTAPASGITQANAPSTPISFSTAGIQAGVVAFHNLLNDRGINQYMRPSRFVLPPTLVFAAREILGSTNRPYTANNEINSLVPEDFQTFIGHYLTSTTAWYLMSMPGEHDLNFAWRDPFIFDYFDDPWTMNAVFTAYFRAVAYWADWRGVYGSSG